MSRSDVVPEAMRVLNQRFHYNPGVRVGDFLFIAGQVGRDRDLNVVVGKEAQFNQAFENVKLILEEAGASFDDVVEMVTYHTDMRDLELFMKVKDRYFVDRFPTWTGIGVSALAMPGLEVEIKCTAWLGD